MSKPVYIAYTVKEYTAGGEKRTAWGRIGAAFAHKDGEGFEIVLDALPVDGRLTLRKPKPGEAEEASELAKAAPHDYGELKRK